MFWPGVGAICTAIHQPFPKPDISRIHPCSSEFKCYSYHNTIPLRLLLLAPYIFYDQAMGAQTVTARKDDAAAADQAATAKVAVSMSAACNGGLIQTTSG